MIKMIKADQVLHGYANGHQLLAASCELCINDRNRIDELSDLNGHCEQQEFVDYYTGYPIENGKKYILAKTWYASEMRRPGCVWTHSVIFDTEDIGHISDIREFFDLFVRPVEAVSYSKYQKKIFIISKEKKLPPIYNEAELQYMIYTIFESANPKYVVTDEKGEQFINELFIVLNSMPSEILKTFTFCTMSYDIRKYGTNEFQYQMSRERNIYRFHRKPYAHMMSIKRYPYWVICYAQELKNGQLDKLQRFIVQYGKEYLNLTDYSQFCRLYFAAINKKDITIKKYFYYIDTIMPFNAEVYQTTIEHILDGDFVIDILQDQEYQILERLDMGMFSLKKEYKELLSKKIIKKTPEKLYPVLQDYIYGKLKPKMQSQVEDIIRILEPKYLDRVSFMDENICVVLVRKNHSLLVCKEIWQQSRDFQRAVLCAGGSQLPKKLKEAVLTNIVQYGTENIVNDIYEFYGDDIIPMVVGLMETMPKEEMRFEDWMPILLRNPLNMFKHINMIPFRRYRLELFLKVDMAKVEKNAIKDEIWIKLYVDIIEGEHDEEIRMKCILQFICVVFGSFWRFDDMIVKNVVKPVYQKAKKNELDFDAWNQFQNLLPEVEDCFAWDKCLRIRQGLEQKGYSISLVEEPI